MMINLKNHNLLLRKEIIMPIYGEDSYENCLVELFSDVLGYSHVYGPNVERDLHSPLYNSVLEESICRINPRASSQGISEALQKLRNFENADLVKKNALFMDYLQNGIEVSFSQNGQIKSEIIYIVDFQNINNNSFIVANQWTFIENSNKRPDILIFLNGIPICLFELKSPSREQTDASEAYTQIRNYMQEIPSMFIYNCICVMSDQLTSKAGTITSGEDRFMEWKTKDGNIESKSFADFTTFFEGIFQKDEKIIPVEVKAEENLRAKSLRQFVLDHPDTKGIRFSMSSYHKQDWMTNIPLYAVHKVLM